MKVAVIGAGGLGLATAVVLARARAGARVEVFDPQAASSASAVAAGMIAPYSEWLLDPVSADHASMLEAAAGLWPDFASATGVELDRSGTLHLAEPAILRAREAQLAIRRVRFERLTPDQTAALSPGLAPRPALWLPGEMRLDPPQALAALAHALEEAGGRIRGSVVSCGAGDRFLADGGPLDADLVVVAAGAGAKALSGAAPELAGLRPIKGQLLRLHAPGASGPSIRGEGVYLAPQAGAVLVGATMAEGRDDLAVDPAVSRAQHAAAAALAPGLLRAQGEARIGVRMAAPDGLPLVGPSSRPGVLLAVGARRNGWLLAPLVARIVAAYAAGSDPGPFAAAFSPARFTSQGNA